MREWLEGLPTSLFARAAFYVDLLADRGPLLGEPYTKQIDGKLRELRFWLEQDALRIVLLTVFRKSRARETRELERARRAYRRCVLDAHTVPDGAEGWDG
ncbi:phage-related protein [Kribbella amoyensis]|uniref:Phage-related protein n=1 Tax=Kribbella amoyensis TaxID=996641 RepID=A0A561BKC8_9ACTN|nr:phage-related protein [Kribbella amoyensis]